MPVPFLRMCTVKCKRFYTLLVIFGTSSLVLYALTSAGNDADKVENPDEVLNSRRRGEDFLVLEKVKERVKSEDTAGEEAIETSLDKKLFGENEGTAGDMEKNGGDQLADSEPKQAAGCDACGETIEDIPLPVTSAVATADEKIPPGASNQTQLDSNREESPKVESVKSAPENKKPLENMAEPSRDNKTLDTGKDLKQQKQTENENNDGVKQWPTTTTDITKDQKRRLSRMDHMCKTSPYLKYQNILYRDTLRHLYVVDSQKLIFCYIPKVGCSNWKRLLMVLDGRRKSTEGITSKEAHAHNGLTRFGWLSMAQQLERLYSYRKVMFVREPFSRIISAFKNKYQDLSVFHASPDYLKQYARRIMRKYRQNATREDLVTGENITWTEFTDYLIDPSERPQFDEHWKESFKLCSPCKIKYDFVGKLENMEAEANYVLQNFNFTKELHYPSFTNSHPTNSTSSDLSKYFVNFTKEKINTLWNIYRTDYALFGYKKPSFIPV